VQAAFNLGVMVGWPGGADAGDVAWPGSHARPAETLAGVLVVADFLARQALAEARSPARKKSQDSKTRLALLSYGSAAVALLVAVLVLGHILVYRPRDLQWLALFLAAQLVWHSLRTSRRRFGAVLFALAVACNVAVMTVALGF